MKIYYTQINWLPESERPSVDLKSQLAEAIAKRDKRKAEAQKAADKLEQEEKEVDRLIAELENEVESIGCISCKISETEKPEVSDSHEIPYGVDVDDPKTWQAGDVVLCVGWDGSFFAVGKEYKITSNINGRPEAIDENDFETFVDQGVFRFVRRP